MQVILHGRERDVIEFKEANYIIKMSTKKEVSKCIYQCGPLPINAHDKKECIPCLLVIFKGEIQCKSDHISVVPGHR